MRKPRKALYLILAFALFLNLLMPPLASAAGEPGTSSNACVETTVEEVGGEEAAPFTTDEAEPSAATEENGAAVVADEEAAASVDGDDSNAEDEGVVEETTPSDEADNSDTTDGVTEETTQPCEEEANEQLAKPLNGLMENANKENIIKSIKMYDKEPTIEDNKLILPDGHEITDPDYTSNPGNRPSTGSAVAIIFEWELGENHSYNGDDIFTFELPDKFRELREPLSGNLDGGVGTYVVNPDRKVTITFSDEVRDNEGNPVDFQGYFYVWIQFDSGKLQGKTEQEFDFSIEGIEKVKVHFKKNNNDGPMKKTATLDKEMNPGEINWVVDFNKDEQQITNAIFTDIFPAGLELVRNSVKIFELDVYVDGKVDVPDDAEPINIPVVPFSLDNGEKEGFNLNFGNINKAYRITYTTKVDPILTDPYKGKIENKAIISGNGNDDLQHDKKEVNLNFSKPLDKKSSYEFINGEHVITWSIQYNYNEQTIVKGNAWIEDTLPKNQDLVNSSFEVYHVTIDSKGKAKRGNQLYDYSFDESFTDGFKLIFNEEINSAYDIVYKTKANVRVYDNESVNNHVKMINNITADASETLKQVIFSKSAGNVNYADKTIEWTINLNRDHKPMSEVVITDDFKDQWLKLQELKVNGELVPIGESEKYEFLVEQDESDSGYDKGFKLKFKNEITSSYVITYKTKFDPTKKNDGYKNEAYLNWKENNEKQNPIQQVITVEPDSYTTDNGKKWGVYNAQSKEITWTIDVNYNLYKISNAEVSDSWIGEQTFDEEDFKVQKLELTGGEDGVKAVDPPLSKDQYTLTSNDNGFVLELGEIDSAYRITYKTSLEDHQVQKEYTNKAILKNKDKDDDEPLFEQSYKVKPKHGGEYIYKTGFQGDGAEADIAFWTVDINPSQSFIAKSSTLTDTLSENQILLEDSFQLYKTDISTDGTVKKAGLVDKELDYNLKVTGNTFTLTFNEELHTAYILEYQSFINANHKEVISNEVKFAGQSTGTIDKSDKFNFDEYRAGAGGGANSPGKGDLEIMKVDAFGEPLEGAVFELWTKDEDRRIAGPVTTDEKGKATFAKLKYVNYKIKEVSAPKGYVVDNQWTEFAFSENNNMATITNTKINHGFELLKVDEQGNALEDAVFKLVKKIDDGDFEVVIDKLKTDENGKILLANLKPGEYQLIETAAPIGYLRDNTSVEFTINPEQTIIKSDQVVNKLIKDGSVELTKVDEYNKSTLEGAKFDLLDDKGNVLKNGLVTNHEGKIIVKDLVGGSYQFVETKAPEGYLLAKTPLNFVIEEGKTEVKVTFKNKMTPGIAKLIKTEFGYPGTTLKGAEFRLFDEFDNPIVDESGNILTWTTDENGELVVPDLRPGKYYFEEIKAPAGYTIKTKQTPLFEIKKGEVTIVTVENYRYTGGGGGDGDGGGGGGGTDPNPSTPNPNKPDPKGPDKEPTDKPDPEKPGKPEEPEKPTDPEKPKKPVEGKVEVPEGSTPKVGKEPEKGTVTVDENGKWVYTPGDDFDGKDSFTIIVTDENGNEEEILIEIGGDVPTGGIKPEEQPGKVLPKTGEDSHLPLQLLGVGLILLGAFLIVRKRFKRTT